MGLRSFPHHSAPYFFPAHICLCGMHVAPFHFINTNSGSSSSVLGMWGAQREQVTCCHSTTEGSGGGHPARGLSRPGTARESHLAWGAGGGQATRRSHSEKLTATSGLTSHSRRRAVLPVPQAEVSRAAGPAEFWVTASSYMHAQRA